LALVDANYCFITVDVGAVGKSSDFNDFKHKNIRRELESNQMGIPGSRSLPNVENGKCMPFMIAGDEMFALSEHVLRPYPKRNLSVQQRIYNYRLTRALRIVECAFGIVANKWRIFHRPLDVTPQFCDNIVKACCILHNFVRRNDGLQLEYNLYESDFESIQATGTRGNVKGKHVRDYFAKYFTSRHGAVPWHYDKL
jgi:hypothetical protein